MTRGGPDRRGGDGVPLAPGMRRLATVIDPVSSVARLSDDEIARRSGASAPRLVAAVLLGSRAQGVAVADRDAGGVPVRVYTPRRASAGMPLVVYLHGGGFVFGDLRGGDWLCSRVARGLGAVVVSADYRLAPRHPFPAAVDDSLAALQWAVAHAHELGADATRVGIMGESAGGNLSAVIALLARDAGGPALRHQGLLYPATGAYGSPSRHRRADAPILTAADMTRFEELYGGDRADWRVSPLAAASHRDLPPAFIAVAGHDPLRDDGVRYAEALRSDGVPVDLVEYPAMPHGFLNFPRFARDAKPAVRALLASQRRALGAGAS